MKYSFIIPVYNNRLALKSTLLALNRQIGFKSEDYEVIVIDDGSSDDTWSIIKDIKRDYELKYIYLERDVGSCRARARNSGLKAAQGKVAVFIDADILVRQDYLKELDRCYRFNENIIVIGTRLLLPKNMIINLDFLFEACTFDSRVISILEARHFIFDRLSYNLSAIKWPGLLFCTCNAAVPVKYLHAAGGFDQHFVGWGMEDSDLGCRLGLLEEIKIIVNSKLEVLHQFHEHEGNMKEEYQYNHKYFLSKFPHAHDGTPMNEVLGINAVFQQPETRYIKKYSNNGNGDRIKVELDLKDARDLLKLKNTITELSCKDNMDIIINDYVENTNLDIWIQLFGVRPSTPKYYPVSKRLKKFKKSEMDRYIKIHMV